MKQAPFFEAAGAEVEISSSLLITNCNQVKLAQILDTHCIMFSIAAGTDLCSSLPHSLIEFVALCIWASLPKC